MRRILSLATVAILFLGVSQARAVTKIFDFEDGTDQGWGSAFGNPDDVVVPVVTIGGSKRLQFSPGGFQAGSVNSNSNPFLAAMNIGVAFPSVSTISYDWYIDTSAGNQGTFLQLGTYINSGQAPFSTAQDFPGTGKDVELNGGDLGSGGVFSGTVTETFAQKYPVIPADFQNSPSQRFGFIINGGNGTNTKVYFDNIKITGVPEPASIALFAMAVPALFAVRRCRK
jgi:hypothetical protein